MDSVALNAVLFVGVDGMKQTRKQTFPSLRRALTIGVVLIVANCYWIGMGRATDQSYTTNISLYYNVVFSLFLLTLFNVPLKKFLPASALSQGELLVVYVMLSIASSLAGLDIIQSLVGIMSTPFAFATPENEWGNLFWRFIPRWLAVEENSVLDNLYNGESTLYTARHVRAWVFPALAWSAFLFALLFIMLCINVVVRKQWVEAEKLTYPIIQLPFEMTREQSGFFVNRLMWLGFGIAFLVNIVNGLHHLFPLVPSLGGELYEKTGRGLDLGRFFTEKPWSAIGSMPVMVIPSIVGLAFFIPLDLSFSFWFFFLFWKLQSVFASYLGLGDLPRFPYFGEQAFGGLIGLCAIALWVSRSHLKKVILTVFSSRSPLDDSTEAIRYKSAFSGIALGMSFITFFCLRAGMSIGAIFVFFTLYFAMSIAITRMRAELGSPVHDFHDSGLAEMITGAIGTRRFGPHNLTMFSFFRFFNRAYRPHPMPHQLEGFKIAERSRISNSGLFLAMVLATVIGALAFFWSYLDAQYQFVGLNTRGRGIHAFNRLRSWLYYPSQPDYAATVAMGAGFLFSLFLMMMRMRFLFWPLHPAGYAVAASYSVRGFWFSIFISWLAKSIILKSGGLKTHRKSIPFFLGIILGEFVAGSFWSLFGIALGKPMYKFLW